MNQDSFSWADQNNSLGSHVDFVSPRTGNRQGSCGICWAFSITQAAEIAYRINFYNQGYDTRGVMVNFSEEAIASERVSQNTDYFSSFVMEYLTCQGIDRDVILNEMVSGNYPLIPEWKSPYLLYDNGTNDLSSIDYGYDTPYGVEYSVGGVDHEYDIWNENNALFQGSPKKGYIDLWKRLWSLNDVKEALSCGMQTNDNFIPEGPVLASILVDDKDKYSRITDTSKLTGHGVVLVGWIDRNIQNQNELCDKIDMNQYLSAVDKEDFCSTPENYDGVFLVLDNHDGGNILYTPYNYFRFSPSIVYAAVKFDFSSYYAPLDDFDNDGIFDVSDNCPYVENGDQRDLDGDGAGDPCDRDIDGDMIENSVDLDVLNANVALDLNNNGKYETMGKMLTGVYSVQKVDCGDALILCDSLYSPNVISEYICIQKCNNSDSYPYVDLNPSSIANRQCKNRNYLNPGCLSAIDNSSDASLIYVLNTLNPCQLVAHSMRYDFYDYWTDIYAERGWWADSSEFYSWLNDRKSKCELFFNPYASQYAEDDIRMIAMENSGVIKWQNVDQYTTVGQYTTGNRFELQFKAKSVTRNQYPDAGSWLWEHLSSYYNVIGGCVCNSVDYNDNKCGKTCNQAAETLFDGEIYNKIWDPVYNQDVCGGFSDTGTNPYPDFCISKTIPSSDSYRSVDFMRDEFFDYDKALFHHDNPTDPAYRHITDLSSGEFTARISKEFCNTDPVEKSSGDCAPNEMVINSKKYSNTIDLLTSTETNFYGAEINLWAPKKLNIFRGYVDSPDIWSFFHGKDGRDFLLQQTSNSPEINRMALTNNSDIIGGSFYEESSEGAFFINCRKTDREIKFTFDKISGYSLEIVKDMGVSGDIPDFETIDFLPLDQERIVVTGLDSDGNLYVGDLNHTKDYADLEIKDSVSGVKSYSSVMLFDSRIIIVANNYDGSTTWYEYYRSGLRDIYKSNESISSMVPYKSSLLAIDDDNHVLFLESFDTWTFEQLPLNGLPTDGDALLGWKLLKSEFPTIMSLESSDKEAFFAYEYDDAGRWERTECLNPI